MYIIKTEPKEYGARLPKGMKEGSLADVVTRPISYTVSIDNVTEEEFEKLFELCEESSRMWWEFLH